MKINKYVYYFLPRFLKEQFEFDCFLNLYQRILPFFLSYRKWKKFKKEKVITIDNKIKYIMEDNLFEVEKQSRRQFKIPIRIYRYEKIN